MNRIESYVRGSASFMYRYMPTGERLAKIDTSSGGAQEWFMYDGQDVAADFSRSGGTGSLSFVRSYVNGRAIDSKIGRVEAGGMLYFYAGDAIGSVHEMIDTSGAVIRQSLYTAWGRDLPGFSGFSSVPDRYAFSQREQDPESALMHYRARSYDPRTGRFAQRDPILLTQGGRSYSYTENEPTNRRDATGLLSENVVSPSFAVARFRFAFSYGDGFVQGLSSHFTGGLYKSPWFRNLVKIILAHRFIGAGAVAEPTGKLSVTERKLFNMTVFTVGKGYVDMGHFIANLQLAYAEQALGSHGDAKRLADDTEVIQEWGRKGLQELLRRGNSTRVLLHLVLNRLGLTLKEAKEGTESAYTIEDLPSNRLGRDFAWSIPLDRELSAGEFANKLSMNFLTSGAAEGSKDTWEREVFPFLRTEVGLINRLYEAFNDRDALRAYAIQTEAREQLGASLPSPRNLTPVPIATPATVRFGDGSGFPKPEYRYSRN